jgi:hypothetical protein
MGLTPIVAVRSKYYSTKDPSTVACGRSSQKEKNVFVGFVDVLCVRILLLLEVFIYYSSIV